MKSRNFTIADLPAHILALNRNKLTRKEVMPDSAKHPRPIALDPAHNAPPPATALSEPGAKRPSKYRNVRTPYRSKGGVDRVYDSAKEARYAMMLDADDRVLVWLPQVHIGLPGFVRYVVDFLVIYRDGRVRWIDVKGRDTQASKNKRKQVEAIYRITVELA